MTTEHLLDPELKPILEFPPFEFTDESLPKIREVLKSREVLGDAQALGVTRNEIALRSEDGAQIRGLLYLPAEADGAPRPGYVHIHGGGYILGTPEQADLVNLPICAKLGAVVLSVDYRLAPEHPIPAPLDDCLAGLGWLHEQAQSLNVDPQRIAIGGESAGGGLAAALAIRARDQSNLAICHQHLTYPMLDNLTGSAGYEGDPLVGEFVWTRQSNQYGWSSYLGDAAAQAPQVPARVVSYEGLPSAWIFTATMDLFRDENITYAQALMQAGVATDLVVYPGACHGFQQVPGTAIGRRFADDHLAGLARGLGVTY